MPTFSLNVATCGSHKHNNRSGYIPPHVDPLLSKKNIVLVDKELKETLHEIFDEELKRYNKGKKPSRQKNINDILNDKKTIVEREIVGTFGDRYFREENEQVQKEMVLAYMQNFESRNPNLKVTQNILHFDEHDGAIHFHIRFIPIYENDKRGMHIKIGMNRALTQITDVDEKIAFETWRNNELSYAESILQRYGEELIEKNESRKHLTKEIYIKQEQLKYQRDNLDKLNDKIIQKEGYIKKLRSNINQLILNYKGFKASNNITDRQIELVKELQKVKQENESLKKERFCENIKNDRIPLKIDRGKERTL